MGTSQSKDVFLLAEPENPEWMLSANVTDDGRYCGSPIAFEQQTRVKWKWNSLKHCNLYLIVCCQPPGTFNDMEGVHG